MTFGFIRTSDDLRESLRISPQRVIHACCLADGSVWWDSDDASRRIGALWRSTSGGGGFKDDPGPDARARARSDAATDPVTLVALSARQVWEVLDSIVREDAFDDGALVTNGRAAANLANELRRRLIEDMSGTLGAIWGDHPWPTDTGVRLRP